MLKKVIKYTDYDDVEREETFYFNLTKAELMEMQLLEEGGLDKAISRILETQNIPETIKIFKELILKSYGEKSPDGKRFIKSKEIVEAFTQTEAFSNLYMELATDDRAASEFVNGIIPKNQPAQGLTN